MNFNNTTAPFPETATLHEVFEQTAARYPGNKAVLYNNESITYTALNEKANRLAHYLRQHGARPDLVIGIITERSFEMIIGIYAILKSGAAYLPLSAADPVMRVQSILADSGPVILLVQKKLYERYAHLHEHVCCIEDVAESDLPSDNLPSLSKANNLAYVIYTSGSTGMPKGVMIEHRSVINRLVWMQRDYPITAEDVILQKTPYTFDVSVWELFWWALEGAAVCMPPQNSEKHPLALVKLVQQNDVTVMHFVPSMLNIFLECIKDTAYLEGLETLRLVFTSGEALQSAHVRKFNEGPRAANGTRLINLYGPTEATVDVTHYECPAENVSDEIPIGKPISNTSMHILKDGMLQPVGVTGELCIAGVGLARGYLNRLDLTRERFIYHEGERMYRTGDLAAWTSDGNILYYGRMDDQVKIRGIRIELGEIEGVLNEYPGIESCVIDVQRPSENVVLLIAYYVAIAAIPGEDIKRHLKERLPDYMIPNFFRRLDVMPLTAHGKLNRKALATIPSN